MIATGARESTDHDRAPVQAPTVAYVVSRFPKLTETFVLYELEAVEALGIHVELYPLLRTREQVVHPEAERWCARARYLPFMSLQILRDNLRSLLRRPGAYLGALATLVRATWGSRNLLLGGLAVFPKAVSAGEAMRAAGVGHVHAHFASHPATAAFVIHRTTGIPFSFTAHGYDVHRDTHMLREKVVDARFVVAVSDYNRQLIVDRCGASTEAKISVLHCGVDVRELTPEPTGRGSRLRILLVASFDPVKGHVHLIEACRTLGEQGVDYELVLVGDGPERPSIEAALRATGVGANARLPGRATRPQVAAALRDADVFVLPSVLTKQGDREGIPVVLMEAMASGVPVVASELSGIPELVEDGRTGLLVPPGDGTAIAAAVLRLWEDRAFAERLVAAARERVEREFDLRTNAAQLARRFCA